MRIHELILKPLFGDKLANLFGRQSPKAIDNFYQATSHHKGRSLYICTFNVISRMTVMIFISLLIDLILFCRQFRSGSYLPRGEISSSQYLHE